MSFSYKTLFRLPRSKEKCLLYYGHNFEDATQTPGKQATYQYNKPMDHIIPMFFEKFLSTHTSLTFQCLYLNLKQ